jgi:Raf kinase inhibitor-like YbhB/YbcL family protein
VVKRTVICILGLTVLFSLQTLNAKDKKKEGTPMELKVTSTAFQEGGEIPVQYTCDGANMSPPLSWSSGPDGTKSYALIADDPDAPMGTWVHWVVYNIPVTAGSFPENVPKTESLSDGTVQGINDFKRYGYGGPCPPGGTHRYYFKVYALDMVMKAGPGLTKKKLLREMEGHILGQGELMGTYSR